MVFGDDELARDNEANLQSYVDEEEAIRVGKVGNHSMEGRVGVQPPGPNTPWERIQCVGSEQYGGPLHMDKSSIPVRHNIPAVAC